MLVRLHKRPIDHLALGVLTSRPHSFDARKCQQLPCKHLPDQGVECPSRLLGKGDLRMEMSLPKSLTWHWKWWREYLFSPEAISIGHASSTLQFPPASWQHPVPSPLWIAPKHSQKLSSNHVFTFPCHECANSTGWHSSWAELPCWVGSWAEHPQDLSQLLASLAQWRKSIKAEINSNPIKLLSKELAWLLAKRGFDGFSDMLKEDSH